MRGSGWLYPERKRCMGCRSYFGFLIVDGLYDSWQCAGRPNPNDAPPEQWPREHYVPQKDGTRKVKRAFLEERKVQQFAKRNGKTAYRCSYCNQWHIGTIRKKGGKDEDH